ncbi:hypothetical protein [Nostoc sp. TCL26-01]|uniref:hypothetical protein n=1 Tax=Nostoc sp. TCL26-01 TaxID=2576904 RepID=UPI0015BDE7D1|nr:hypothetical protein [Nostoc sp. TCL26-01]
MQNYNRMTSDSLAMFRKKLHKFENGQWSIVISQWSMVNSHYFFILNFEFIRLLHSLTLSLPHSARAASPRFR